MLGLGERREEKEKIERRRGIERDRERRTKENIGFG